MDGDGDLDAVAATSTAATQVWKNDGTGDFTDSGQSLGAISSRHVALGDIDGDGRRDRVGVDHERSPDAVLLLGLASCAQFAGEQEFRGRSTDRHRIDIPMRLVEGEQDLVLEKNGAGRLYYRLAGGGR